MINVKFINQFLLQDMEIYDKIFPSINFTVTRYGSSALKQRLTYFSVDNLENMIAITKYINNANNYRNKIESLLTDISTNKNTIDDWNNNFCDGDLYFVGYSEIFNNEFNLNITNKIKFSNVVILIIFYIIMYIFFNATGIKMSITDYLKSIATGYYYMASLILSVFIGSETIVDWLSKGLTFLYLAYNIYSVYQTIITCVKHYTKCNEFKDTYHKMIKVINICKNIWDLDMFKEKVLDESTLNLTTHSFVKLEKIFSDKESLGYMIVTKLDCHKYQHYLSNILEYVGIVDMLISNSKLLRNGYTSPYIDMAYDKPYIVAEKIWNPLLNYKTQVKNECTVGLDNHQNMIITGPNKAGKSTYLRSLILSIYLAQTLGVTCAQKLYFTPFSEIFTYLNVPDTVGKESLFEAELERCYKYYNKVITSNPTNKVIGFIDELFTGTNYYEGMAGSYAIVKKITESPYSITILTTHFHEICTIPNVSYNKFYATHGAGDASNTSKSKYKFSYMIEKGISDQCIALDLLQERGYGNELIEIAKTKLSEALNKKNNKNITS